jgi:hypothetical protein
MTDAFWDRDTVIAAYSIDVAPGEFHPFDGLCGTCRGTGEVLVAGKPSARYPGTILPSRFERCEQCNGRGYGPPGVLHATS